MSLIEIEIVSTEATVFSGQAKFVSLPGENGELGILPGHTPLISKVKPGTVYIEMENSNSEYIFIAGGILEIQPNKITVLSDTAIRGKDLDEAKALKAKQLAEENLANREQKFNLAVAQSELIIATAQLAAIARLRNKRY